MKKIVLICCFCFGYSLHAQPYETGVVLDSLPVVNSQGETFALYLPKDYTPAELWPILFVFSPSGNANKGIEVFKSSAESFNYILVCSNDSRNGSYNRNFAIAERLLNHVFTNFKIAENRIYLAGFSGGSRLATAIAVLNGQMQGVIGCGAGFASVPNYIPSKQDFYYVGICGDRDMNYREMLDTSAYLNRLKFRNTLFTFDGNHRWPPKEQIFMAFESLEIEAHQKGILKKTDVQLKKSYIRNYKLVKAAISNSEPLLAAERYKYLLNTYSLNYNLDSIQNRLQSLQKSKIYINVLNQRNKAFEKEAVLSEKLISRYMMEYDNPERANLKWWEKELEKLEKKAAKSNLETQKMLERVLYKLFAAAYELTLSESNISPAQREFRKTFLSKMRNRFFRKNI